MESEIQPIKLKYFIMDWKYKCLNAKYLRMYELGGGICLGQPIERVRIGTKLNIQT